MPDHSQGFEIHPFFSGKWEGNLSIENRNWFKGKASFGYLPSLEIRAMFLGSFPTYEVVNLERTGGNLEFFYGSTSNQFWKVLPLLTGDLIKTEKHCMSLLDNLSIGLTDILHTVKREGRSANDASLESVAYNDILEIMDHCPNLDTFYLTSGGKAGIGPASSNSAGKWFYTYLRKKGYSCNGFGVPGARKRVKLTPSKTINVISLFSPSNAANLSLQGIINGNNLSPLFSKYLPTYSHVSDCNKLRMLQWAYYLKESTAKIEPSILDCLEKNGFDAIFSN